MELLVHRCHIKIERKAGREGDRWRERTDRGGEKRGGHQECLGTSEAEGARQVDLRRGGGSWSRRMEGSCEYCVALGRKKPGTAVETCYRTHG